MEINKVSASASDEMKRAAEKVLHDLVTLEYSLSLPGRQRMEVVRRAWQRAEEGRGRIREARSKAWGVLRIGKTDHAYTDDEVRRSEREIQSYAEKFTGEVDGRLKSMEDSMMAGVPTPKCSSCGVPIPRYTGGHISDIHQVTLCSPCYGKHTLRR